MWGPVERRVIGRTDDVIFIEADAPIVINGDGQYYYRVIYDDYTPFHALPAVLKDDTERRMMQTKLLDDVIFSMFSGYVDADLAFRFVVHCGLDMPASFYEHQFRILLKSHLYRQDIEEWNVMDIVEQLFDPSDAAPPAVYLYSTLGTYCKKEGVNNTDQALEMYTRGKMYGMNSEAYYLSECTFPQNKTCAISTGHGLPSLPTTTQSDPRTPIWPSRSPFSPL
ncbi:hypothetical protein PENTCL1PPCAC_2819, partial [Pristionchus entomophagus]